MLFELLLLETLFLKVAVYTEEPFRFPKLSLR